MYLTVDSFTFEYGTVDEGLRKQIAIMNGT